MRTMGWGCACSPCPLAVVPGGLFRPGHGKRRERKGENTQRKKTQEEIMVSCEPLWRNRKNENEGRNKEEKHRQHSKLE